MALSNYSMRISKCLIQNPVKTASFLKCYESPLMVAHLFLVKNYSLKSGIPIKWVRPEKIPCYKPEKSGDLQPLKQIDITQLSPEFRDLDEIKTADENVKKLFTLEYQPYKSTVAALRADYLKKVRRHQFDENSPEARIAKMTADIRDMQKTVEHFPRDKRTKVRLKETIDKRKRLLKYLRTWDYKCFEYVLEKLDLIYKPFPPGDVYRRVERKRSLRMLTKQHCDNIVATKLSEYRSSLEAQQEDFLVEKLNSLNWIMEQEKLLGVTPTVTDADVTATEEKLKQLRRERKQENVLVNE